MIIPNTYTPVIRKRIDDINTPVSAFLKLNSQNSFLLESISGGEQVARYSYIGLNPIAEFKLTPQGDTFINGTKITPKTDPISELESLFTQFKVLFDPKDDLPTFAGGAVGYFGWETIQYIEPITFSQKKGSDFPMMHFIIPQVLIAFDHAKRHIILIAFEDTHSKGTATQLLDDIEAKLDQAISAKPIQSPNSKGLLQNTPDSPSSNHTQTQYETAVEKAKHHILEGDVFQLVLSQKFTVNTPKPPFDVYRNLRTINPSPYMYFFQFPEYAVIGASPEILTSLSGTKATLRPIAGTRPRQDTNEDALITELLNDPKEIAEHIMLVDLARNDLGRVCDYNSIVVTELKVIEKYSHVMHIVSNVQGQLKPNKTAFDLFKATFPAGTLSGAPKIKAIQLIEAIEPDRRGPYGGALGYFDFRGNMDLCILIRTLLYKDHQYHIQAGAGIVADSVPKTEYEESQNKAKGIIQSCM